MNDDDEHYRNVPERRKETQLATSTGSKLPDMGGVVNRWLDHFRSLDNVARMELVQSLTNRINAEGELVDSYVSFERKKRQLIQLDEILDDEDEELRFQREERQHQRELRRRERERELNPPEPAVAEQSTPGRKKRGPSKKERLQSEAESIVQYGTTSERGKIAEAFIDELRTENGEDESAWPDEIQERARQLRRWKLRDA